jgi:hypothetical protein
MSYPHSLIHASADAIAGWERAGPLADDDPQARVVLLSPELPAGGAAEAIPSWAADTPAGSWVELQLRARRDGRWSRFYRLARWDSAAADSRRTSFDRQDDDDGQVATDTLLIAGPAEALQARVLLCAEPGADMPDLERLTICLSHEAPAPAAAAGAPPPSSIDMPLLLSQYAYDAGAGWCSPTAVAMSLGYWRARTGDARLAPFDGPGCVPELAAPQIYDPAWGGTGNWSFNVAFAAARGLVAYVTRLHSLEQLARWTAAGVPVVISLAWQEGQIDGAPSATAGHLTLVTGFEAGRALIAEPAGRGGPEAIRRAYPADQLYAAWQERSAGTVYLIYPAGWPTPAPGPGDAWI